MRDFKKRKFCVDEKVYYDYLWYFVFDVYKEMFVVLVTFVY